MAVMIKLRLPEGVKDIREVQSLPGMAGVHLYPASVVPPARLRDLLRNTAEPKGGPGFNNDYGYGVINVAALLAQLSGASTEAALPTTPSRTDSRRATSSAGRGGRQ
jgi:hypothetical protein